MSMNKAGKFVKKMKFQSNSIIMIREDCEIATENAVRTLQAAIEGSGLKNVVVIVSNSLDNVRVVYEQEMAKNGWYHIDTLRGILKTDKPKLASEKENEKI